MIFIDQDLAYFAQMFSDPSQTYTIDALRAEADRWRDNSPALAKRIELMIQPILDEEARRASIDPDYRPDPRTEYCVTMPRSGFITTPLR